MKIFVTGGTGFFGRALLRYWRERALQGGPFPHVTVVSRSPHKFLDRYKEYSNLPWLRFYSGDILDKDSLPQGESFTHILHAATDSTVGPQLAPLLRYSQIVDGTRNILEYAVRSGAGRMLLTSSGGVYGPQPHDLGQIPEDYCGMPDPLTSANVYGVAKRAAEHLCALYQDAYGLETVIARCFAFVGEDLPLDVHFAIGNFLRDALWNREITIGGDGTPIRSYMDQRDLANWLWSMLMEGRSGRAYNVGSDEAISIRDLAYVIRDIVSPGKNVRIEGGVSNNLRNQYVPNITRARLELKLSNSYTLEESIRHAAHGISKNSC